MAITELKILKYECKKCLHDWMMINPGKDSRSLEDNGYFCPYCGKHSSNDVTLPYVEDNYRRDEMDEATRMPMQAPIIVQKKTDKQLKAEDKITHLRCTDGGWWNPITKECQGEGVGHNLELDNDSDS